MIPFATTLNNHTVAACTALFALYPALKAFAGKSHGRTNVARDSVAEAATEWRATSPEAFAPSPALRLSPSLFLVSGFFAGFTACSELPATSFLVFLFLILFWRDRIKTLAYFLPAAAIPIAFFFLTNYWALGQWMPAYGEFGGPWYEYEGSHWKTNPGETRHGIDFAYMYESKIAYGFHLLLGHHGLFSLTPIFLFGLAGSVAGVVAMRHGKDPGRRPGLIGGITLALLLVVIGFYIIRTGNYGGWTAGPRWLIWLTPFLLLAMLPAVDWLAPRRGGRVLAYLFLAISMISSSYPAWNPWRHPWLYNLMEKFDLFRY